MRAWITTALLITFFSGASTGFLVGRTTAPVPKGGTWIDGYVAQLKARGVTDEADLTKAREILEGFESNVRAMKGRVRELLRDRLTALQNDAARQIQEIIDASSAPPAGTKER